MFDIRNVANLKRTQFVWRGRIPQGRFCGIEGRERGIAAVGQHLFAASKGREQGIAAVGQHLNVRRPFKSLTRQELPGIFRGRVRLEPIAGPGEMTSRCGFLTIRACPCAGAVQSHLPAGTEATEKTIS